MFAFRGMIYGSAPGVREGSGASNVAVRTALIESPSDLSVL